MRHLAFIPARGGSVGIPNKNLQEVHGLSLVERSWLHAHQCGFFDFSVISTDSYQIASAIFSGLTKDDFLNLHEEEIKELSEGAFLHRRPRGDAQTLSPIKDTLFKLSQKTFAEFDLVWMLQPTTPFRNLEESKNIKKLSEDTSGWSSIVSMKDTGGVHPDRMYRLKEKFAEPFINQSKGDNIPRQLLEKLYIKDGAYYVLRRSNLLERIMLGYEVLPFIRSGKWTINIDTLEDLELAQSLKEIN